MIRRLLLVLVALVVQDHRFQSRIDVDPIGRVEALVGVLIVTPAAVLIPVLLAVA